MHRATRTVRFADATVELRPRSSLIKRRSGVRIAKPSRREKKQATRERIVRAASEHFRKEGVDAVAIADVMGAVGLTHGGFYAHFQSKQTLLREAVTDAFRRMVKQSGRAAAAQQRGLEAIVRGYLSAKHRDRPDRGCVAAALAAEIARGPQSTKAALSGALETFIALIGEQLSGRDPQARRRLAVAILGLMMGTLQMARVAVDRRMADEILMNGIDAALALGGNRSDRG